MKILVANDDGINAAGIKALVKALSSVAEVYVAAPKGQQSGKSHSLTLKEPIEAIEVELEGATKAWQIDGTPADCTRLGLQFAREEGINIDMVFTGINLGSNLGKDTVYSGTVGAAMEAAMDGYHSVAVSVDSHKATYFDYACNLALKVIDLIYNKFPKNVVININTPNLPPEEIKGTKITYLGPRYYDDRYIPQGNNMYKIEGETAFVGEVPPGCDIEANFAGYASITPISFDLTSYHLIETVRKWQI